MIYRGSPGIPVSLVWVMLAACSGPPREQSAPNPPWSIERAEVLFTRHRDGVSDLYVHDRATGETRRLTMFGTPDGGANAGRVSPDGKRVAFQVRRGSDYEIYVMDLAGGASQNVTRHPEYDVNPAWSPDSRQLAFMSTRDQDTRVVWTMKGNQPFLLKLITLFVSHDRLMGKHFEAGLANLRATAEGGSR